MSDPWASVLGPGAQPPPPPPTPAAPAAQPAPQGADPWHSVLGPGAATPTTTAAPPAANPASSYDPSWKPSGNAFWDFLTMPRAKSEDPISAAKDVGLSALDWGTQGLGVKGFDPKDVAQAHANMGIMDYPTAAIAYTAGPGKILGPLARGSALAEGGLAGLTSTVGHGDYNPWDIAENTGLGALGGKVGQQVGKYGGAGLRWAAGKLGLGGDPAAVTEAAQTAKTAAYSKLDDVFYHPVDVGLGVDDVKSSIYTNDVDGSLRANSPQTADILDKYYNRMNDAAVARGTTTGGSLNDTIKQLSSVARKNPNNFEGVAAAQARDGLTDLFHTATPLPGGAPSGYDPAKALAEAKQANAQFKNAEALQGWQREVGKYGGNVGNDVKAYNEDWYGQNGTPQDSALMRIYNAQQQSGALPRWQTTLAHEGLHSAVAGALGETAGQHWGMGFGPGALSGLATYAIAKPMLKGFQNFSQGLDTQQAFDQAYPAMTGKFLSPVNTAGFQETMRRLGISLGTDR
jgi:hypothetical protein